MHSSSKIVRDVVIKGTLSFQNKLFLDSVFEGEISGNGDLIVGDNAQIKASIHVNNITIHGTVEGDIYAENLCKILEKGCITGDIKSQKLEIEEGASFNGYAIVPCKSIAETELPIINEIEKLDERIDSTEELQKLQMILSKSID